MKQDIRPYQLQGSGQVTLTTSAQRLSDFGGLLVRIKALSTNAGSIFIGKAGVTTSNGFELQPGDDLGTVPFENLNQVYAVAANGGDKLSYLVLG